MLLKDVEGRTRLSLATDSSTGSVIQFLNSDAKRRIQISAMPGLNAVCVYDVNGVPSLLAGTSADRFSGLGILRDNKLIWQAPTGQ